MVDAMLTNDGKIIALKDIKEGEHIKIDLKDVKIANEVQKGDLKLEEEGETAVINLPEWLAQKKGLSSEIVCIIKKETKKAVLVKLNQEEFWLPKSEIDIEI
ncbi:MAG: hypothetical protein ACPK7O_10300 [Methanobacterium sp.]